MYERFEPSDRIFVDREEYLDWMAEALERCKERSVVLHLRGIGGIGKSSLLDHWTSTIDSTIRLDCEQYAEFYDRLNVLAKGAVLLGVRLRRFDVLWQIRQRFVEGVEPVKEEGREWAKDIAMAIPFIGSLASIGSAISAAGGKVAPKLKNKYGDVAKWLQTRLGKDHVERLLEILWKEPRHAEFLYLDALLEDMNRRKSLDPPILFLLDHFEYVDSEKARWRYGGRQITESELWGVFLSSLSNCVGVMAGRRAASEQPEIDIEESELTELDRESCIELLELRSITDSEVQNSLVSVSGGNPFVIGTLCDMTESGTLSPEDLEGLHGDTLEEVRLKTWRRLFNQAQDLLGFVERAGLLPFFNRRVMNIIAPGMNPDQWDRLIRLSFVRNRGDGTWVLHDLAEELVLAELGQRLGNLTDEVTGLLERASTDESDYALLGLALSVQALAAERDTAAKLGSIVSDLIWRADYSDALTLLDAVRIDTNEGHVVVQGLRGRILTHMNRVAEGEHALWEALETSQEFGKRIPEELLVHIAQTQRGLGALLSRTGRISEAEKALQESLKTYRELNETTLGFRPQDMAWTLLWLGWLLMSVHRLEEGENVTREALQLYEKSTPTALYDPMRGITMSLRNISLALFLAGRVSESEVVQRDVLGICRELVSKSPDNISEIRDLKISLGNLGETLSRTSRPYEAVDLLRESLQLTREMAKKEPEVFLQVVAWGLVYLALPLRQTGRYSEAEKAYLEALDIARELAGKAPDVFSRLIAWTLSDFAVLLRQTGRTSEAEEAGREALRTRGELAAMSPDKYDYEISWNLNNLGVLLRQTGRTAEAEDAYREALHTAREISQKAPEAVFLFDLVATILSNLAVLLRQTGRTSKAEEASLEALEIRKRLAHKSPGLFLHRVTTTLNNLGVLLAETGRTSEAEDAFREALQLRRELVRKSPDQYQPGVGSTLNNLAILLRRTGRTLESENAYHQVIDIGEELVSKAPTVYQHDLARTLCNYAILMSDIESTDEAAQKIKTRLKELGVESPTESEEWSEEEEEEANPVVAL
ncbi:MAG: tetratricopeptide repeat protein [Candidatus Thorarchaeota archaeon]|jgi:tetratricopeptide (TPR) repeat protein